jgi:Domain of unknown function (DUF1854)
VSEFDLQVDAQGRLTLSRPGTEDVADVRLRRAFPWSLPGQFVSVRNKEGKEIFAIEDVDALPEKVRQTVDNYLSGTSFIPVIRRVIELDVRFGYQKWTVETDRGPADFRVQEREDIRFMPDGRFAVKDADGNLYELPPLGELDEESRRALEAVV